MEAPVAGRTVLLTMLAQQLRTALRCLQHGAPHSQAPLTACDGHRSDDFAGRIGSAAHSIALLTALGSPLTSTRDST